MALTDTAVRNTKPAARPRKLFDGGGLFLMITPKGQRLWRMKYRHGDKERLLAFGIYPHVTLAQARERRDAAKALLAQGIDPSEHQKEMAAAKKRTDEGTFDRAAEAWLAFKSAEWSDESRRKAEYVTRTYLIPALGKFSMATLSGQDVVPVLRKIAAKALDLARKARQYVKAIVLFAMREGLRDEGRMLMLDGALPRAANRSHIPAATLPEEAAEVMRAVTSHSVDVMTRAALLLCAYTAQRPGVVVAMCWDEVVLKAGEWRIPAAKMKTRHAHIVPLPRQAGALLRDMAVLYQRSGVCLSALGAAEDAPPVPGFPVAGVGPAWTGG